MVFDLRAALLKKEEIESARLMEFDFRQRARCFRLLGAALTPPDDTLATMIALGDDATILAELAETRECDREALFALYLTCREAARQQLIGEIGDPTPHRLG